MTEHESNDNTADSTADLLSGDSAFSSAITVTEILENPAIADAMIAENDPSAGISAAIAEPKKRRGRRTNAEIAADKAKEAAKNGINGKPESPGFMPAIPIATRGNDDFAKLVVGASTLPQSASPLILIDFAVSVFADSPTHADLTWIIASISEWIPAVSYRGIFRAIAQTHGEVGIYYALQVICPHIRREKRSGMAVAASMSAASARAMGLGIDQGDGNMDLTKRIGTQVLANRYAGLGTAEVMEIMREIMREPVV